MKITFADLWRSSETIDRGPYAVVWLVGFALKHNLDRVVATLVFHRPWGLFNYWVPVRDVARVTALRTGDALFLSTMLGLALPFVWVGVALTTRRLRSANLPSSLALLFFVPFLNLLFLLLLCLVPARDPASTEHSGQWPRSSSFARIIPESVLGSAAISLVFPGWISDGVDRGKVADELWLGPVRCFAIRHGIRGGPHLRSPPVA